MRVKKLIEKLEDLATFLTLAANDAGEASLKGMRNERYTDFDYWRGREEGYKLAFEKLDGIIKEAKR